MNTTLNAQSIFLIGIVVLMLIGIGVALWFLYQKEQSRRLQRRFGSEYGRTVDRLGSRMKAEVDLKAREKRVERLNIVPLAPPDAERFADSWRVLQSRFVDNPKGVVVQADQLVRELMQKRGYPMGDFKSRAADISVDHPIVVENYRLAQAIAIRDAAGEADTEELRRAVVHYRAVFGELLETRDANRNTVPRNAVPAGRVGVRS